MDILKFTRKRAAAMVDKVLKSAVADADEQQADVDSLYVSDVRIDDAGIRVRNKALSGQGQGQGAFDFAEGLPYYGNSNRRIALLLMSQQ